MFFYTAFIGLLILGSRQWPWLYGGLVASAMVARLHVYPEGEKARHQFGLFPSDLVFVIGMLALCIIVGLATHLLVEKPIGRILRQRINRMKCLNRA